MTMRNSEPERTENLALTVALTLAFIISIVMIMQTLVGVVRAEPLTTFRDTKGQVTGYGSTRGNTTTFENSKGQHIGRAERSRDGSVRFYNEKGQSIGTAKTRR